MYEKIRCKVPSFKELLGNRIHSTFTVIKALITTYFMGAGTPVQEFKITQNNKMICDTQPFEIFIARLYDLMGKDNVR